MKYLIVGLGNIGPEYHETRHNIGFMAVDALAKAAGATFTDGRYGFTTTLQMCSRLRGNFARRQNCTKKEPSFRMTLCI